MGNLLYLVHRLPFPPNKGDKVRSFHLLKHLASKHNVFLGTFIDDPEDEVYLEKVRALCQELHVERLRPRLAKLRSLTSLPRNEALSLGYYRDRGLATWCKKLITRHRIDATVVFSSAMAQYAPMATDTPRLVDFVDVDSAKWVQYAQSHRWPMSWLYRREGERLLAYERDVAAAAERSFFVTENETEMFRRLAPESANKVDVLSNGVDASFFSTDPARASPYGRTSESSEQILPLVFTGAMDYWPNIDAVTWMVREILPALLQRWPSLHFYIVGRSPTPAVLALSSERVLVTGTVPDVRPYLQYAAVVVAPLRVARGIQNKILEAMAMARPVVASSSCTEAIGAREGVELVSATTTEEFVRQIDILLRSPESANAIGEAGQMKVRQSFSWDAHLSGIDRFLDDCVMRNN